MASSKSQCDSMLVINFETVHWVVFQGIPQGQAKAVVGIVEIEGETRCVVAGPWGYSKIPKTFHNGMSDGGLIRRAGK